jgi:hypothetical protein
MRPAPVPVIQHAVRIGRNDIRTIKAPAQLIAEETEKWAKVIRAVNIKVVTPTPSR